MMRIEYNLDYFEYLFITYDKKFNFDNWYLSLNIE